MCARLSMVVRCSRGRYKYPYVMIQPRRIEAFDLRVKWNSVCFNDQQKKNIALFAHCINVQPPSSVWAVTAVKRKRGREVVFGWRKTME